eukprot:214824_1
MTGFFWIPFAFTLSTAMNDIDFIKTEILDHTSASSGATLTITLWYNSTIYQYNVTSPNQATAYEAYLQSAPVLSVLHSSDCYTFEPKVMFEKHGPNAVFIDKISFHTISGLWYGIDEICRDTEQPDALFLQSDNVCASGFYHYSNIGIDLDDPLDFSPHKQLIYFDMTTPNQFITNALLVDGTTIDPVQETCNPTLNPTKTTNFPTQAPTIMPTMVSESAIFLGTMCSVLYPDTGDVNHADTMNDERGSVLGAFSVFFGIVAALLCVIFLVGSVCILKRVYKQVTLDKHDTYQRMIYNSENFFEALLVSQWVEQFPSLAEAGYCDVFINNGYYTLDAIKQITDESQLNAIGIWRTAHQYVIMNAVAKLRGGSDDAVVEVEEEIDTELLKAIMISENEMKQEMEDEMKHKKVVGPVAVGSRTPSDAGGMEADEFVIKGDDEDSAADAEQTAGGTIGGTIGDEYEERGDIPTREGPVVGEDGEE